MARAARHAESRAWLYERQASGELLIAPALLVPEVASAIARRSGRPGLGRRAIALLLRSAQLRLVAVDPQLAEEAGQLAADCALRGADAVYVAVAKRLSIPLVTWDGEQLERARGAVEVSAPNRRA